jgi:glutamate carboxypeptidase
MKMSCWGVDGIREYIEQQAGEQLRLVVDLCNQNSYTHNAAGTNAVADMLLDSLGGLLPHERTFRQEEVGNHHVLSGRRTGKSIHIVGHLDTVFPPEHEFQKCTIEGEWLRGPGCGDMKGGLAVIVYALKALDHACLLDDIPLTLVFNADEETGAATSRPIFERERARSIACLVAECAGPAGEVVLSRNGKAGLRLACRGRGVHVGRAGGEKKSAILEIAHKVIALEGLNGFLPGLSVNVGTIEGGLGPCTVPDAATCLIDLRWVDEVHYGVALARMQEISAEPRCEGCLCSLEVLNHRPAMPVSEATESLYATLEKVAGRAGIAVGKEHRRGTSDANFFGAAGVPTIDGLGPVCHDDHTERERIHIPSLAARTRLLALLLAELAGA